VFFDAILNRYNEESQSLSKLKEFVVVGIKFLKDFAIIFYVIED
jgi:hypothetical protein